MVELAHQRLDVGVDDVAAILAQMRGDAVGAGGLAAIAAARSGSGRLAAARVADGGDVIDVHAETQGLGHWLALGMLD